uniref:Putative secreted protein n=1 Tax=Anopheles triannulatus TaxID=58253 RepID=A0A2M4B226_9DIPT
MTWFASVFTFVTSVSRTRSFGMPVSISFLISSRHTLEFENVWMLWARLSSRLSSIIQSGSRISAPIATMLNSVPASTSVAPRHPNSLINHWQSGAYTNVPIPVPDAPIPVAKVRRLSNQNATLTTTVTYPTPRPTPASMPNVRYSCSIDWA